jgi:hypothetical protein
VSLEWGAPHEEGPKTNLKKIDLLNHINHIKTYCMGSRGRKRDVPSKGGIIKTQI